MELLSRVECVIQSLHAETTPGAFLDRGLGCAQALGDTRVGKHVPGDKPARPQIIGGRQSQQEAECLGMKIFGSQDVWMQLFL